jgi:orotidine-5'-phosphate decarboxylase
MKLHQLDQQIILKHSILCIGLDPDLDKLPTHFQKDPESVLTFCKQIIDATNKHCIAYKPNLAFFEALGTDGWDILKEIANYIPHDILKIADAKRGDIGNTSLKYAQAVFETLGYDAITVAPYMGKDSVTPFLEHKDKFVIILGLTSNIGSNDFQRSKLSNGKLLYQHVIEQCASWGREDQIMFVVGATHSQDFEDVRKIIPDHYLLVPGIGAQGGDLDAVLRLGKGSTNLRLIINASRSIIYASSSNLFDQEANLQAQKLNKQISYIFNTQ